MLAACQVLHNQCCGSRSGSRQTSSFGRIRIGINFQGMPIRIGINARHMKKLMNYFSTISICCPKYLKLWHLWDRWEDKIVKWLSCDWKLKIRIFQHVWNLD
jgi:hypothetical protein